MTWERIDGDWGQVTAAYAAFCQPDEICRVLDEAMEKKWKISSPREPWNKPSEQSAKQTRSKSRG